MQDRNVVVQEYNSFKQRLEAQMIAFQLQLEQQKASGPSVIAVAVDFEGLIKKTEQVLRVIEFLKDRYVDAEQENLKKYIECLKQMNNMYVALQSNLSPLSKNPATNKEGAPEEKINVSDCSTLLAPLNHSLDAITVIINSEKDEDVHANLRKEFIDELKCCFAITTVLLVVIPVVVIYGFPLLGILPVLAAAKALQMLVISLICAAASALCSTAIAEHNYNKKLNSGFFPTQTAKDVANQKEAAKAVLSPTPSCE